MGAQAVTGDDRAYSLIKNIYRPFPVLPEGLSEPSDTDGAALVNTALRSLSDALRNEDVQQLKQNFLSSQAYWRDLISFTAHIRTLNDGPVIAPALHELAKARGLVDGFNFVAGSTHDIVVGPHLRWIQSSFTFETARPKSKGAGSVQLMPEKNADGQISWKIWTLTTWMEDYIDYPENEELLTAPGRKLDDLQHIDTDVLIVGGGNAGLVTAARLKAVSVESVVVDIHARPGDNWANRYESVKFHIGKNACNLPFLRFPEKFPQILTRDMLSAHMREYADKFNLNILHSSRLIGSSFSRSRGIWSAKIQTPFGIKTLTAKQLVQATGLGSDIAYTPKLPGKELYKGVAELHTKHYKSPKQLLDNGAKSVIVVGSANSAFDVIDDCATAGLQTTMIARSKTYIFPWEYSLMPDGFGLYDVLPTKTVDDMFMSGPVAVGGQLQRGRWAHEAATVDKDRYKPLLEKGFPVYDSTDGAADLSTHLLEFGGKHFNDIGNGVRYIVEGKVAVRGLVEPTAYTATGLLLSDGTTVDADAIIWATGFAGDKSRETTAAVLGGETFVGNEENGATECKDVLGPRLVSELRDEIWGVDFEGEVRGCFRRHPRVENYFVIGGGTTHHRFHSKHIALLMKGALEGILPEAFLDTPE